MGEESGVPVGLFLIIIFFFRAAKKKNCQRGRGCLHGSVVHICKKVEAAKRKNCKNRLFLMTCQVVISI